MILFDFFEGGEDLYYLTEDPIILYLLGLLYVCVMTFIIMFLNCVNRSTDKFNY